MNKKELVEILAANNDMTKAASGKVIDAIFDVMTSALTKGEKVTIPGFGTIEVRDRAAKQSRNPRTGEMVQVPAKKAVVFKPGKSLKDTVNG